MIKKENDLFPKNIYFAGKVRQNCWRYDLFKDLRVMSKHSKIYSTYKGEIQYNGPYALSCDHGCFHRGLGHGLLECLGEPDGGFMEMKNDYVQCRIKPKQAVQNCLQHISDCDAVIAYIETLDCYGTLIELGYAASESKPVYLYIKASLWAESGYFDNHDCGHGLEKEKDELWFIKNLPNVKGIFIGAPTQENLPEELFPPQVKMTHKEKYRAYLESEKWKSIRNKKISESGNRCQLCNKSGLLNVHHRTYDNVFNEKMEDLIVLCRECHAHFHHKTLAKAA